jgi:hypothetical protein
MNELIQIPSGTPSRVSLEIPEGVDFLEWKRIGHSLFRCEDSLNFWLGDWLNYGERNYGQKYHEALLMFGDEYEIGTLHNIASVAKRVEISRRRELLSWSHHEAVASLDEKDQNELLALAEDKNLSTRQLIAEKRKRFKDSTAADAINSMAGAFMWESWLATQHLKLQKQLEAMPVEKWDDTTLANRLRGFDRMEKPLRDEANKRGLKV